MSTVSRRVLLGAGAGALAAAAVSLPTRAEESPDAEFATKLLATMSLEDKVSQLFVQHIHGTSATEADSRNEALYGVARPVDVVQQLRLGGVVITSETGDFGGSAKKVQDFTNALQNAAMQGGRPALQVVTTRSGNELRAQGIPITEFPNEMAFGAVQGSVAIGWGINDYQPKEAGVLGINSYLGIVADVESNPGNPVRGVRSHGSDPDIVTRRVRNFVDGAQLGGPILSGIQRFPGGGDVTQGPDGLPVLNHSREDWDRIDAVPFKQLTNTSYVNTVLVGHIVAPALDPSGLPASLSAPIITGILRKEFRYGGIVITDALTEPSLRQRYGDAELAVMALEAGADQLLMSADPRVAHAAVVAAVGSGRLTEQDIDRKAKRVLRMKYSQGPREEEDLRNIGGEGTRQAVDRVATRAITLVRNDNVLPLSASGSKVLVVGSRAGFVKEFGDALGKTGANVSVVTFDDHPTADQAAQVQQAAGSVDAVVALTYNVAENTEQADLVNALHGAGRRVIAVAVGNPYDVGRYGSAAALCTYSDQSLMATPLATIITGGRKPEGKLPVAIPTSEGSIPVGTGLTW